jgi:hypothetical protein
MRFPSSLLGLRDDEGGQETRGGFDGVVGGPVLVVLVVIAEVVAVVV